MPEIDPFQTPDDAARALARRLIDDATYGALAVLTPEGTPSVTRIAVATDKDGTPVTLISTLSTHTPALLVDPRCSLLLGEPEDKGDPLTHPRITLDCRAVFLDRGTPGHTNLRAHYLAQRPKAKLYVDFGDFRFVRLELQTAMLNGGFGKAFRLTAADLQRAE
ncbi:pyridoxamine 5'-phosphate oxidase family protein [Shimia sp. SDUM112013]|uniref:HugZ family pyridoxamine 5'-phosphate oxidase n=1 Tax=Shimia sp. SDUM112013 TaxID=3136160 RepID=UPI0032EF5DA2